MVNLQASLISIRKEEKRRKKQKRRKKKKRRKKIEKKKKKEGTLKSFQNPCSGQMKYLKDKPVPNQTKRLFSITCKTFK